MPALPLRREEGFLSAQADRFAGAKREEKASACSARNDTRGERRMGSRFAPSAHNEEETRAAGEPNSSLSAE